MNIKDFDEMLTADQHDGTKLKADEIYQTVIDFLKQKGAVGYVPKNLIEQYAMCYARWAQCERKTNEKGFVLKSPQTGKPIDSPFVAMGIDYMKQAQNIWDQITKLLPKDSGGRIGKKKG